jgi:hypothetical protein
VTGIAFGVPGGKSPKRTVVDPSGLRTPVMLFTVYASRSFGSKKPAAL